jgi:hypothetical protein
VSWRRSPGEFFTSKGWTADILKEDTFLSYFWWIPQIFSHSEYKQLFAVWLEVRRHAHEVDFLPKFNRFKAIHFAAKAATAFRKAAVMAHLARFKLSAELCEFAHDKAPLFEMWAADILHAQRRRR